MAEPSEPNEPNEPSEPNEYDDAMAAEYCHEFPHTSSLKALNELALMFAAAREKERRATIEVCARVAVALGDAEDREIDRLVALFERVDELAKGGSGPWSAAIRVRCAEALGRPVPDLREK